MSEAAGSFDYYTDCIDRQARGESIGKAAMITLAGSYAWFKSAGRCLTPENGST